MQTADLEPHFQIQVMHCITFPLVLNTHT